MCFQNKIQPDGSILKYKARLVAKDFHQIHGIDYTETFSLVVKASTVSITVMNNWVLRQINVNNAFLNGILDGEVYMTHLEGFIDPHKPQRICKLRKAIYGSKQAPRAWFARLKTTMLSQWHFQSSKSDNSLFYKRENCHLLLVLVYVDNIIVIGSSSAKVQQVIQDMQKTFALKDLGELNYFLGIEVSKLQNVIHLSQATYIADILAKDDLVNCSLVPTPMSTGQQLTKDSGSEISNISQYRSIIKAL